MARRLPANLAILHAAFDPKRIGDILPGDTFTVDGIEFVCAYLPESTPERFFIVKEKPLVDRYIRLCEEHRHGRIVELGIAEGGSTALMALVAEPAALVAVDLESEPLDALDELIRTRGLTDSVHPHYGVDQADRATLARIVDEDLGGEPIDLVIDDCSHQLGPTRASFETLFPRLRPGGLYLIEDWNADHLMRETVAAALQAELAAGNTELRDQMLAALADPPPAEEQREPLSRLAIELFIIRAGHSDAIAEIVIDEHWITVRRGPGQLDPDTFRLADTPDFFGFKTW